MILISEPTTQGDVRSCINFEEVQKIEKIIHGESNNKNEKKKIFFNRSTRSKTWKCVSSKKKGREISFDSRGEKMVGGDRS